MINTYNESKLHHTLKNMYSLEFNGKQEVKLDGFICDILAEDDSIIEIQTGSLGKLKEKCGVFLRTHNVRIVYPMVTCNYIHLTDEKGEKISRRKSPKKLNWLSLFSQITGLTDLLLKPGFTLEVIQITQEEHRIRTEEPVQLKNRSRRFRKNWYKSDKELLAITDRKVFTSAEDYFALLPQELPEVFSSRNLKEMGCGKEANMILWVLFHMGAIEKCGKNGKLIEYKNNTHRQATD